MIEYPYMLSMLVAVIKVCIHHLSLCACIIQQGGFVLAMANSLILSITHSPKHSRPFSLSQSLTRNAFIPSLVKSDSYSVSPVTNTPHPDPISLSCTNSHVLSLAIISFVDVLPLTHAPTSPHANHHQMSCSHCSILLDRIVTPIHVMMTSSNGNIFRVTGPLCGEFTGHRWIPLTKASDAERWCFLWSASEQTPPFPLWRHGNGIEWLGWCLRVWFANKYATNIYSSVMYLFSIPFLAKSPYL